MDVSSNILIFIVSAFLLGVVVIVKKDSLPQRLRRPLAIISILMIAFAFFLIMYSLLTMGS
ncbi:hypothetical protein J45TS6_18230 [Paenibacillus sp. J45TS6]|uniref:Signal transduction histidine kinase n=1 Tax=Paenibacillus gallinarum TaxID=2762232 RepID=A0ABR8SU90_9BACL|nr:MULTISPECIES: hypothetical protein [Paenibacillus]MBD7967057.1 hypothetical protein [Paenibacillus gallinarum]GIP43364.1 hypothetical protein J45TS6_18230 [Paenibacillus sp. J45TS6]